jgi:hypothetical protein
MSFSIPKTQKVAIIPKKGEGVQIQSDYPVVQPKELKPGECLVKIEATGTSKLWLAWHLILTGFRMLPYRSPRCS